MLKNQLLALLQVTCASVVHTHVRVCVFVRVCESVRAGREQRALVSPEPQRQFSKLGHVARRRWV